MQPRTFNLEVTEQELNAISQGLVELPWKVANPVIQKLHGQLQAQLQPAPAPAAEGTAE
jgi:hypothetical protein